MVTKMIINFDSYQKLINAILFIRIRNSID